MRAVSDKQFAEPSDLEEFFLECVEKARAAHAIRTGVAAAPEPQSSLLPPRSVDGSLLLPLLYIIFANVGFAADVRAGSGFSLYYLIV